MTDDKIILECLCGTELLQVQYDEEMNSYYLAIFERFSHRSWKNKIRHIWHIIRFGEPYEDQMIIDRDIMLKLVKFLQNDEK